MPTWNESAWFAMFVGVALKSTGVFGVAWLVTILMRRRSAAARHLVWTAAAASVLALPLLSISLPDLPVRVASELLPGSVLFQTTATGAEAASQSALALPDSGGQAQSAAWRPQWRIGLMLFWAAGALVALTQMLFAFAGMWRVRRAAARMADQGVSEELARTMGIGHTVDVLETPPGSMPMTLGVLRPSVLLPHDATGWSTECRRMVLLHELAHIRRGDNATQMLARLALILNWWNPLAWIAWREFLKERERAADDLVLQAGARASEYASHLLEIARAHRPMPGLGWAAVTIARRSQLEGRLLAILDGGVRRNATGRTAALVAMAVAVAIVAPLAAVRAQQSPPPQPNPIFRVSQEEAPKDLHRSGAEIALKQLTLTAGTGSVEYGLGLLKIAAHEKQQNHAAEAEAVYTKAVQVLGDRSEAIPALIYLGIRQKENDKAVEYFERAQRIDPVKAGAAMMWMALIRERQQRVAEAESLYRSALAVQNPASADAAITMDLFARLLNKQNREAEGAAMRDRATEIRKDIVRLDAARHPRTSASSVLRIGGDVKAPTLAFKKEPEYSEEARVAKFQGTVVVSVEIGADGVAQNMHVVRSLGLGLDENAIRAISQWRFNPGIKDGNPVTVAATIEVNFRLL